MGETPSPAEEYRAAYDAWHADLEEVHAFLLDRKPLHPTKVKGLLNREARAKERYDRARNSLLGLD